MFTTGPFCSPSSSSTSGMSCDSINNSAASRNLRSDNQQLFIDALLASPAAFGVGIGGSPQLADDGLSSLLTPDLASLSMSSSRRTSNSSSSSSSAALYALSSTTSSPSLIAAVGPPVLPLIDQHHAPSSVPSIPWSSGPSLASNDCRLKPTLEHHQHQLASHTQQQQQHQRRHSVHHLPYQHQASSLSLLAPATARQARQLTPTSIDWIFEQQRPAVDPCTSSATVRLSPVLPLLDSPAAAAMAVGPLVASLDVASSSASPNALESETAPAETQGNAFDIDALLAQAAADAHAELAQRHHAQSHALIPMINPSAFAVLGASNGVPIDAPAAATRKRKRSATGDPSSSSSSSSPDLTAATWPHHQPAPALLSAAPTFEPTLLTDLHALTHPVHSSQSSANLAFVDGPAFCDPIGAYHTVGPPTTSAADPAPPIPALSMFNPAAPMSDTVIGRLRIGQRRDYTVPRTVPLHASDDGDDDDAAHVWAARRPSLPTIVEGRTAAAPANVSMRGPAPIAGGHARTLSMPELHVPCAADTDTDSPQVLEIKFACEVGGMEPVKRRKVRRGKGGRKVVSAMDEVEGADASADEAEERGYDRRRRGSASSQTSTSDALPAAVCSDRDAGKCPACDLPEGTLMRSSPLLCPACVAKRKRAVEAATRAFLERHRGKTSECIACHEVKSVVHDFSRLGMEYRRICKRCDYQAQKERKKKQLAAKEAEQQATDAAAQDTPQQVAV